MNRHDVTDADAGHASWQEWSRCKIDHADKEDIAWNRMMLPLSQASVDDDNVCKSTGDRGSPISRSPHLILPACLKIRAVG